MVGSEGGTQYILHMVDRRADRSRENMNMYFFVLD